MENKICIRKAKDDDIEIILGMIKKREELLEDVDIKDLMNVAKLDSVKDTIMNKINDHIIVVAELEGKVAGFIEAVFKRPDYLFFPDRYTYINNFYIDECINQNEAVEELRNKLFLHIEQASKTYGIKYICADVYRKDERLMELLKYNGMEKYRHRLYKPLGKKKED